MYMGCSPLPSPKKKIEVIKFDKKIVYLKDPRLDSSDLLIAQLVERQTSIHEVVGSSPTRRSKFSNLNLYNSPCVRVYGVPSLSHKKKHTHAYTHRHAHKRRWVGSGIIDATPKKSIILRPYPLLDGNIHGMPPNAPKKKPWHFKARYNMTSHQEMVSAIVPLLYLIDVHAQVAVN